MKVLLLNCVFRKGSTGKIVGDIRDCLLAHNIECVVCYGRGDVSDEPGVIKVSKEWYSKLNGLRGRVTGLLYGGAYFSTHYLEKIIVQEKPDVVHVHCINGNFLNIYRFITFLKNKKIRTLLTLHAEFMHTANCGNSYECNKWLSGCGGCPRYRLDGSWWFDRTAHSWNLMKSAFSGFDRNRIIVSSVSPWLKNRAERSPILKNLLHCVVQNGLDTSVFHYRWDNELRKDLGIRPSGKMVFHATPIFDADVNNIKGGYHIIRLAELMPDVAFVIAGRYDAHLEVPDNIILLGSVSNQSLLAKYYATADVCVLTSKQETFSMVCAESLCCGTPVVGFNAGAPEMISLPAYSVFVEYGDVQTLKRAIYAMIDRRLKKEEIAASAAQHYSKQRMTDEYLKLYNRLLEQ